MRLSHILSILLVLVLPACVPTVTHGPRVEPGTTVGSVIALGTRPTLEKEIETGQGSVTPVAPPMGFFARYGWTGEGTDTPLRVSAGVFLPLALPFSVTHPELDVYAQLTPAAHPTAASAGVLVSRSYVSPYVQLGRGLGEQSIYTTQSIAFFAGSGPRATVWMPAVAMKFGGAHLFVQGGLGRERMRDQGGLETTRPVRFLMGGVVAEAPLGRRRRPF
jgi:hypothetical protein